MRVQYWVSGFSVLDNIFLLLLYLFGVITSFKS